MIPGLTQHCVCILNCTSPTFTGNAKGSTKEKWPLGSASIQEGEGGPAGRCACKCIISMPVVCEGKGQGRGGADTQTTVQLLKPVVYTHLTQKVFFQKLLLAYIRSNFPIAQYWNLISGQVVWVSLTILKTENHTFKKMYFPISVPCGITVGATVAKTPLTAWLLSKPKQQQEESQFDLETKISKLCKKNKKKTLSSVFVTLWSIRKKANFDSSQAQVVRWNIYQRGIRLWHITRVLSIKWMSVHSLGLNSVSITHPLHLLCPLRQQVFFFFCSVEFPQLIRLFDRYLGIATGEETAFSCFGSTMSDALCAAIWPLHSVTDEEKWHHPCIDWLSSRVDFSSKNNQHLFQMDNLKQNACVMYI